MPTSLRKSRVGSDAHIAPQIPVGSDAHIAPRSNEIAPNTAEACGHASLRHGEIFILKPLARVFIYIIPFYEVIVFVSDDMIIIILLPN